jgi:ribose 5-phosphate isomerase B
MRVALGADHAGVQLKDSVRSFLESRGIEVQDAGTLDEASVDYPDYAALVGHAVAGGTVDRGILVCGTGLGMAIAANKIDGVRAAMCVTETLARYSREHNGANVLTLGATLLTPAEATAIVTRFIETPMREARYVARLAKIARLEHR